MKIIYFTLIALSCYNFSSAQTPQEINQQFFELYKKGDTDKALDYLFSNMPYKSNIEEGIEDVKRQLKKQTGQIGTFYGADLLTTRTAGPNVILFTYLVRHAREPLTFSIMYYKPDHKWQMQSFKYANETSNELEEASKAWRMRENFE